MTQEEFERIYYPKILKVHSKTHSLDDLTKKLISIQPFKIKESSQTQKDINSSRYRIYNHRNTGRAVPRYDLRTDELDEAEVKHYEDNQEMYHEQKTLREIYYL